MEEWRGTGRRAQRSVAGARARLRLFEQQHIPLNMVIALPSLDGIKRAVEMRLGVALLPRRCAVTEIAGGRLVALPVAGDLPLASGDAGLSEGAPVPRSQCVPRGGTGQSQICWGATPVVADRFTDATPPGTTDTDSSEAAWCRRGLTRIPKRTGGDLRPAGRPRSDPGASPSGSTGRSGMTSRRCRRHLSGDLEEHPRL